MKALCVVCGKPAAEHERTTDGTYLHSGCAAPLTPALLGKSEKGKNLYGGER